MRLDVYGVLAAVERLVRDGANDNVRCFLDYSSYDLQIGRNKINYYCSF